MTHDHEVSCKLRAVFCASTYSCVLIVGGAHASSSHTNAQGFPDTIDQGIFVLARLGYFLATIEVLLETLLDLNLFEISFVYLVVEGLVDACFTHDRKSEVSKTEGDGVHQLQSWDTLLCYHHSRPTRRVDRRVAVLGSTNCSGHRRVNLRTICKLAQAYNSV